MRMTSSQEAQWYDRQYYARVQKEMPSWYRFLLPELLPLLDQQTKLLELGCGQGHLLRALAQNRTIKETNLFGADHSSAAIEFVMRALPEANLQIRDLHDLDYPAETFDIVLIMETIEHLRDPVRVLKGVYRWLKPKGLLFLSFPNYLNFPWLIVRLLAEKLNRPNWIVLQPIDKIYTVFGIIKMARAAGLEFKGGIGSTYFPPILYRFETEPITRRLNALKLYKISFHPILRFTKEPGNL